MDQLKKYNSDKKPIWCPRCGDYGFLSALIKTFEELNIPPHETVLVSGIGCSGRTPAFIRTFGFHTAHGRVLPVATGVKLANSKLNVIGISGDGDGLAIGMGHFPHAVRRNVNMVYFILDNSIYGLTKGQSSPTTFPGQITKTNPYDTDGGVIEPVTIALASGAGFVARLYSAKMKQMLEIIPKALNYNGFALVHVISPCSVFNDTYAHFNDLVKPVSDDYEPVDKFEAMKLAASTDPVYTGIFYQEEKSTLDDRMDKVIQEKFDEKLDIIDLARQWSRQ